LKFACNSYLQSVNESNKKIILTIHFQEKTYFWNIMRKMKYLNKYIHHLLKRPDNKRPDSFSNVQDVTSWQKSQIIQFLKRPDTFRFWKKRGFLIDVVLLLKSGIFHCSKYEVIWKKLRVRICFGLEKGIMLEGTDFELNIYK
jgi:hypothetical protein